MIRKITWLDPPSPNQLSAALSTALHTRLGPTQTTRLHLSGKSHRPEILDSASADVLFIGTPSPTTHTPRTENRSTALKTMTDYVLSADKVTGPDESTAPGQKTNTKHWRPSLLKDAHQLKKITTATGASELRWEDSLWWGEEQWGTGPQRWITTHTQKKNPKLTLDYYF